MVDTGTSSSSESDMGRDDSSSGPEPEPEPDPDQGVPGKPPIYLGMTVHRLRQNSTAATLLSTASGSGASNKEKDLDDLVDYPVEADEDVKYFVEAGEEFFLNIYLSNPDNYEIQSLFLNGQKYTSYMFEEGSDLEKIVIRLTAPNTPGYMTYHIGSMKYLDQNVFRDVEMNSDTTVQVGVPYDKEPTCESKLEVYADGAVAQLDVEDPYNLSKDYPIYFYLSDGEEIVKKQEIRLGQTEIRMPDLNTNSTYQYGVITAYDSADGQYDHAEWLVKESFQTKPPLDFGMVQADKGRIVFSLKSDTETFDDVEIEKAILYDGVNPVQEKTGEAQEFFSFDNLYSDHLYTIEVQYAYVLDGERKEDSIKTQIKTEGRITPTVSLELLDSGYSSLSVALHVEDPDNTFAFLDVKISDKDGLVRTITEYKDNYTFDDLLTGHSYSIVAEYAYDLNDANGRCFATATLSAMTKEVRTPVVQEKKATIGDGTLDLSYVLMPAEYGAIDGIALSLDGTPIERRDGSEAFFEDLLPDRTYTVEVSYHYDIKDGRGLQKKTKTYTYRTYGDFGVRSFTAEGNNVIHMGDMIVFHIVLKNSNYKITNVVINGIMMKVLSISSKENILVQFVNDGSLGTGEVVFHLDAIYFEKDGKEEMVQADAQTNTFVVNGRLVLKELTLCDENGQKLDYLVKGEKAYVLLTVTNETQFVIDRIYADEACTEEWEFTKRDPEHYMIPVSYDEAGSYTFSVSRIDYENIYETTYSERFMSIPITVLEEDDPVTIDDIGDLQDVDDYRYYRLEKDLDLSSYDGLGFDLRGVFDGNGHTISGFQYYGSLAENGSIGLFSDAEGVIKGLTVDDFFFCPSLPVDDTEEHERFMGFFAGTGTLLTIQNSRVGSNCQMYVANNLGVLSGGFVGVGVDVVQIRDSINESNIQTSGTASGFVSSTDVSGTGFPGYFALDRCVNDGIMVTNVRGSGGFGEMYDEAYFSISDCLNNGLIDNYGDSTIGYTKGALYSEVPSDGFAYVDHCVNTNGLFPLAVPGNGRVKGTNLVDFFSYGTYFFGMDDIECRWLNYNATPFEMSHFDYYDAMGFDPSLWHIEVRYDTETDTIEQDVSLAIDA